MPKNFSKSKPLPKNRVEEVMYDKSRLRCFVSIFGRDTPVELGFDQVQRLDA